MQVAVLAWRYYWSSLRRHAALTRSAGSDPRDAVLFYTIAINILNIYAF